MATHSCILAWKIPWTEEPGGLQSSGAWWATVLGSLVGYSPWGRKESDMTEHAAQASTFALTFVGEEKISPS